jgi:hypothetical protein
MLKKELIKELTEILIVELQENLKENIQNQLKECQDNTSKKLEKTQEQLNEFRTSMNSKMKQNNIHIYV